MTKTVGYRGIISI